jgi:hypothetical protein
MVSQDDSWAFKKIWKRKVPSRNITEKHFDDLTSASSTPSGQNLASPSPVPTIPGKDLNFGTSAVLKTFYEGKNSRGSHYDWVETPPKQLNKKIAKAYDRVAIKIYKVKDSEQPTISGRTPLKVHMVEIQSPVLVGALEGILKHENVFLEVTEVAKFEEPFKPLYFCYDKIVALYRKLDEESILKQHLQLLLQVMADLFSGFMTQLKHLQASELISYKLAWTYFPKDSIVYSSGTDCERLCRVVDTEYRDGRNPRMAITCQEIGFDAESFVWRTIELEIPPFEGNLPVTALPNYPLSFHEDPEAVKKRLTLRGKKVLDYQQLSYCEYSGVAIWRKGCDVEKHNVWKQPKRVRTNTSLMIRCRCLAGFSSMLMDTINITWLYKEGKVQTGSKRKAIIAMLAMVNNRQKIPRISSALTTTSSKRTKMKCSQESKISFSCLQF